MNINLIEVSMVGSACYVEPEMEVCNSLSDEIKRIWAEVNPVAKEMAVWLFEKECSFYSENKDLLNDLDVLSNDVVAKSFQKALLKQTDVFLKKENSRNPVEYFDGFFEDEINEEIMLEREKSHKVSVIDYDKLKKDISDDLKRPINWSSK